MFFPMKKMKLIFTISGVSIFLLTAAVVGYIKSGWGSAQSTSDEQIIFEIKKGSGVSSVARNLKQAGLLNDPFLFKLYFKINSGKNNIKPGVYSIPKNASIEGLADLFYFGKVATHKVTIPEGRASWEIISILTSNFPHLDSLILDSLVYDEALIKKLGVEGSSLEGYLFPDTYRFPLKATEKDMISEMVKASEKAFESLGYRNSEVYKKYGKVGVMTLASIVEEEAAVRSEQTEIAGVFYNRLLKGMPMGADPTVRFIFRNLKGPIYRSQLNFKSPYNTRRSDSRGLPPGPISNPGKGAIAASLYPKDTKNLYFVGKDDGTMEHFFAPNLKMHNYYRTVAAKNRKIRNKPQL